MCVVLMIKGRRVLALCVAVALVCSTQPAAAACASYSAPDVSAATAQQQQKDDPNKKKKEKKKEEEKKKEKETEEEKGTLGTFESEATDEKPDSDRVEAEESSEWWGFFGKVTLYAIVGGAVGSWYRVTGSPADPELEQGWGLREAGEATIPFVGLNFNYQNIESDVEALDVNIESGYGPLGVHYRFTRFQEEDPNTDLDFSWLHGVLRLSYSRYVEVGLGFGAIFLDGTSSESGGSFMLPIRIEPSRYFGFDYRPTWGWINGNTISDHDLALRVGIRYVSIRAGYRWTKVGRSTLEGPIIGLLLSY